MAESSTKVLHANAAEPTKPHHVPVVGSVHANHSSSPVVLRSLSNKIRVVTEDITDDDGDYGDDDSDKSSDDGWNSRRGFFSPGKQKTHDSKYEDYDDIVGRSPKHDAARIQGKNKLKKPLLRSMSKYAKAQGMDLRKHVEGRSTQHNEHSASNSASVEMEEMRKILEERKENSEDYEYHLPTESDRDTSPERNRQKRKENHRDHHKGDVFCTGKTQNRTFDSPNVHEVKDMVSKSPSQVLEWLGADGRKTADRKIAVSKHRIISLLQALNETARLQAGIRDSLASIRNEWVPAERLREAEIRSSVAEEQIKQYEQLLSSVNDKNDEERLNNVFSRTKTIERHFAHMKKFAEDRQQDLRKHYVLGSTDRKGVRALYSLRSRSRDVSSEKAKQDLQEHENHKKHLLQVQSMYNDLLSFLRLEHSKRLEVESKNQQISMQIKKQTDALKRTEKVIKHTVLTGLESHGGSSLRSSLSSRHMSFDMGSSHPLTDLESTGAETQHIYDRGIHKTCSRNTSIADHHGLQCQQSFHKSRKMHGPKFTTMPSYQNTDTGSYPYLHLLKRDANSDHVISASEASSSTQFLQNTSNVFLSDTREFEELEQALLQEGKAQGFVDVDLYSEKKTTGKNEETSWEYKHVHLNFNKPQDATFNHGNVLESSAQASIQSNDVSPSSNIRSTDAISISCIDEMMPDSKHTSQAYSIENHISSDCNMATKNDNVRNNSKHNVNIDHPQCHIYEHDNSSTRQEIDNEILDHNYCKQELSCSKDTKASGIWSKQQHGPKRIVSLPAGNLMKEARKYGINKLKRLVKSMPERARPTEEITFLHSKGALTGEGSHRNYQLIKNHDARNLSKGGECVIGAAAAAENDNHLCNQPSVQNKNLERKIQQKCRCLFVQIFIFCIFLIWCTFTIFRWSITAPPT